MPARGPANDEERLPWLEPYRDPSRPAPRAKAPPPAPGRRRGAGLVAGGVAALAAALGAGYWIGQRDAVPPPRARTVAVAEKPVVAAPPVAVVEAVPPPTAESALTEAKPLPEPRPVIRTAARKHMPKPSRRKIRNAGIEAEHLRAVRAAQERVSAPVPPPRPVVHRAWPKMPSPGPAGQVIQLGAFTTPTRAHAAYRQRLARYPLLGRMPLVVVPVITRPRGKILYVLRLGTTSRQQSATVCRNLRASGDHCLVIG